METGGPWVSDLDSENGSMKQPWRCLIVAICLLGEASGGLAQSGQIEQELARERRWAEQTYLALARGNPRKRAAMALRDAPMATTTIEALLYQDRVDDALRQLKLAAAADSATLIAAFGAAGRVGHAFSMNASAGHQEKLGEIAALARLRLPELPREERAQLAWVLIAVDMAVSRAQGWDQRLGEFATTYAGTSAALGAEVDLIEWRNDTVRRIELLDQFWRTHGSTEAGAKALYLKGFHLSTNVPITGVEKRGSDPTERLVQVADIVEELESGRYPDSEWVRRAPGLVSGFYVSESPPVTYAPGNIERGLAVYQRFVEKHFRADGDEDPFAGSVGYVITSKMSNLYNLQGDRYGGIERTLAGVEAHGGDKAEVDLFRAQFLLRRIQGTGPAQPALATEAEQVLRRLVTLNAGYPSRKALGLLAGHFRSQQKYASAKAAYAQLVAQDPSRPFAWIADLYAAQCLEAEGNIPQAIAAYEGLATKYAHEPLAQVVGPAAAAQLLDQRAEFDRALGLYRRALASWDSDYGPDVTPPGTLASPRPTASEAAVTQRRITQQDLADRVAALERNVSQPGGPALERGRWQLGALQFSAARETLLQAEGQADGATETEARALRHRAELELILERLTAAGTKPDDAAALTALEALAGEPFDASVGAAGLAHAMLVFQLGRGADARAHFKSALDAWLVDQAPLRSQAPTPIDADVAALREVVFQPTGKLAILNQAKSLSQEFPSDVSFVIVRPEVTVKTADGHVSSRLLYQQFSDFGQALFFTREEQLLIVRVLLAVGKLVPPGAKPDPERGLQSPQNPFDPIALVREFLPIRATSLREWSAERKLETHPTIGVIEFTNPQRTRANVGVAFGWIGATIMLEKVDGKWRALRVVNIWMS